MFKLSPIQKITFSALMIVLNIVCTRLLSFQNVIPFIRISLGPAIVVLASIALGPIYGGIVGGGGDILGIVLFPNSLGYSINPLFTIVYTLFGIVPYFIFKLFKLIKSEKISLLTMILTFIVLLLGASAFLFISKDVTILNYDLNTVSKVITIAILAFLITSLTVGIYFINKSFKKKNKDINVYALTIAIAISELLIMTILNSIVKSYMFDVSFSFIFLMQLIVFFINVPLYTVFTTYVLVLFQRMFQSRAK